MFQHPGQGLAPGRHLEKACREKAGRVERKKEGVGRALEGASENADPPRVSQRITQPHNRFHNCTHTHKASHSRTTAHMSWHHKHSVTDIM